MTQMTWHCMTWAAALLTNSWAPPISLILWSPSIELKNAYYSLKKPHKHFCSFLKLNFAFMLVLSIPSTTSTLNTSVGTKPTTGRRHGMDWTLTTAKRCHFRFSRGHFGAFGVLAASGSRGMAGSGLSGFDGSTGWAGRGKLPNLNF